MAERIAIGDEFHARNQDGEMRRVYDDTDFEAETAWCAQCGTPLDPNSTYYDCETYECDAILCGECEGRPGVGCYCPRHRGNAMLLTSKEAEYTYPYAFGTGGDRSPPTVASNGWRGRRLNTVVAYGFPTCFGTSDIFSGVSQGTP